jgi:hypothetical protein
MRNLSIVFALLLLIPLHVSEATAKPHHRQVKGYVRHGPSYVIQTTRYQQSEGLRHSGGEFGSMRWWEGHQGSGGGGGGGGGGGSM